MSTTFDSKTIVMMAENGHSVEIDGKKIQMTIVSKAKPHPNALTIDELEDGKSYLLAKKDGYMENGSKFCTKGFYYLAVSSFMYFASEDVSEGETDHVLTDEKFIEEHFTKYIHKSEAKPNYSHLVGKWVKVPRRCHQYWDERIKEGGWLQIEDLRTHGGFWFFNRSFYLSAQYLDLSNPLDHNPDDVRVFDVPSEIKILHGSLGLLLEFSAHQALWYCKEKHCYGVRLHDTPQPFIPCIATECKYEDLKEGDLFFATNDEKPRFTSLRMYNFLGKDGSFIWTGGAAVNVLVGHKYNHYFKITPKP